MSRIPLPYTQKVLDLFRNPKNLGKLEDANVIAVAGNPACGDMITFYMKINNQAVIEKISFESYGCAANIATASIVTEMIKGLNVKSAWKDVTWKKVTEEVGGLPNVKFHCGILAVGAVKVLGIPCGLIINRSDIGDDQVKKYAAIREVPILMEIPFDRRIAEAYSRGDVLIEVMPEWKAKFLALYDQITEIVAYHKD